MRIGISAGNFLLPWPFFDFDAILEVAGKHDLGLEIFARRGLEIDDVISRTKAFGVPILGIHASFWWDNAGRRVCRESIRRRKDDLNARIGFWLSEALVGAESKSESRYWANKLGKEAYINYHPDVVARIDPETLRSFGHRVLVENDGGSIWPFSKTIQLADRLKIGMTLDTSHVALESLDLIEAYDRVAHRLVNVHFSDGVTGRDEHRVPGSGELNLPTFLKRLRKDNFHKRAETSLIIEIRPPLHFRKIEPKIVRTMSFIRDFLG